LTKAQEYGWQLDAWAVFSNHYHFVGHALDDAGSLKPFLSHVHSDTARLVNLRDNEEGRQVWYNFWETELTYENSYLARLNYVHQNAVHHGLVAVANRYRWCSAGWFERTATPAQVKTIYGFKADKIRVVDDFDVLGVQ
jgi:putative transposase